jgi:DNA primase
MRIPEEKVSEIRDKSDIVEVISENIDLKRRGSNYVGFSPFKDEKTPSFVVSPDKQIFKDFSSGKAGNVITFLMEFHGMTFVESCKNLAIKYGVELQDFKEEDSEEIRRTQAYKAAEFAAGKYNKLLLGKEGRDTYDYFLSRNFNNELIEKFHLGYAPDSWNFILNSAKKAGFSQENLIDAGLIIDKENKQYDRFRHRAIFTIRDYIGRTLGFGGRILTDDKGQAKYINSPQTLIYDKSNVLYGLYEGKNAIRNKKSAILVEGYADVLAMHGGGFENVVASSGTSLTSGQLKLLKRYASSLIFMMDADSAGINAMEKGLILAIEQNFEVKIAMLQPGEDPDTMLKKHGKKSIEFALRDALDFIDFKMHIFKQSEKLDTPQGLSESVKDLISIIKKIPDKLQHDFYISKIASEFKLTENQLKLIYNENPSYHKKSQKSESQENKNQILADISDKLLPEELIIIKFILSKEENLHILFEKFDFSIDLIRSSYGQRIFHLIMDYSEKPHILDAILTDSNANESFKNFIADIAINDEKPSENWKYYMKHFEEQGFEVSINDAIKSLKIRKVEIELSLLKQKLANNPKDVELLKSFSEANNKRVKLFNSKSINV